MNRNTLHKVADYLRRPDWQSLGLSDLSFQERSLRQHRVRAKWTGEKRYPKAGEWFLSGAVVEAYRAQKDLSTPYHIAALVLTETVTVTREVVR